MVTRKSKKENNPLETLVQTGELSSGLGKSAGSDTSVTNTSAEKNSKSIGSKNNSNSDSGNSLEINPHRASEILSECERQGLSLQHLVKTIKAATEANKVMVDKYGQEIVSEDFLVRLKAAMIGLELRGELKTKTGEPSSTTNIYALQVNQILDALKLKEPLSSKTMIVKRDIGA